MSKTKVLFVSQQIEPYIEEGHLSHVSRYLPQSTQERGKEIRTFMPRYGCINERRYQLHEVIRLSGMNQIIDDSDHPLIIKVASIQAARMQVYFIDNEEYFQRKTTFRDERGKFHKDNDERMIFFCRGVLETVKKLGWAPDIIHCHGWMTSLLPYYLKKVYNDEPVFANTRIVYSVYDEGFTESLDKRLTVKLEAGEEFAEQLKVLDDPTFDNLNKFAIAMADGVIAGSEKVNAASEKAMKQTDKMILGYQPLDTYADAYSDFYDELLESNPVLAS
ncbi:MAG TPA: glycogen synthase [Flavobacteriales bacterium]|jgi:starch synthase|nr:glycogen synthase [Flavobacteriales bacterium]HIO68461.1 glycogen synthase [Flavobacteriales bacterium]